MANLNRAFSKILAQLLVLLLCQLHAYELNRHVHKRSAQEILQQWKKEFDMNVGFQLRKIGIKNVNSGERIS